MTVLYARTAGGNWNTAATWSLSSGGGADGSVPISADDVILDSNSGNVTIDTVAYCRCRSLDMTSGTGNYTNVLTHSSSARLYIGTNSAGPGNVAVKFLGSKYSGALSGLIIFEANIVGTPIQTIDFAGNDTGSTSFAESQGNYQLTGTWGTSSVNPAMTVTLTKGTLDTNGQTCYWGNMAYSNSNTRSLTLGTSVIHMLGAGTSTSVWVGTVSTGLTFSGASATILFDAVSYSSGNYLWAFGSQEIGSITANGAGVPIVYGTLATIGTLTRIGTNVKTDGITLYGDFTIKTELKLQGYDPTSHLLIQSSVLGTPRTITITGATCANCTNVDFRDITFSGTASAGFGDWIGDCGGNTFPAPLAATTADDWYFYQTANGGTHNFSDYTQWYTETNGGGTQMASTRCPLPQDNCYFDGSSINGTGTVTVDQDMPRVCKTLDFTGVDPMAFHMNNIAQTIYGSLILASNVTPTFGSSITLEGRGTHIITSANKTFNSTTFTIAAFGGSYSLQDDFGCYRFGIANGEFDANDKNVLLTAWLQCNGYVARGLKMGNGTWTLSGTAYNIWNFSSIQNLTFDAEGSTIEITGNGTAVVADMPAFESYSLTYNNIIISGGGYQKFTNGSNSFNNLTITGPKTVKFTKGTVQTIRGKFIQTATKESQRVKLDTVDGLGSFTITSNTKQDPFKFVTVKNSRLTGNAKWDATDLSNQDLGNNVGWLFDAGQLIKNPDYRTHSNYAGWKRITWTQPQPLAPTIIHLKKERNIVDDWMQYGKTCAKYPSLWKNCVFASGPLMPEGAVLKDYSERTAGATWSVGAGDVPKYTQASMRGQAFWAGKYDGTNDYASLTASIFPTNADFTISAWIGPVNPAVNYVPVAFGDATYSYCIIGKYTALETSLRFAMYNGALNWKSATSTATVAANQLVHLTGTRSGNTIQIYVDGIAGTATTFTGEIQAASVADIGAITSSGRSFFACGIAGVSVYRRALTTNEIAILASHPLAAYEVDGPHTFRSIAVPTRLQYSQPIVVPNRERLYQ